VIAQKGSTYIWMAKFHMRFQTSLANVYKAKWINKHDDILVLMLLNIFKICYRYDIAISRFRCLQMVLVFSLALKSRTLCNVKRHGLICALTAKHDIFAGDLFCEFAKEIFFRIICRDRED